MSCCFCSVDYVVLVAVCNKRQRRGEVTARSAHNAVVTNAVGNGFAVSAPLLLLCKRQTKSQNRHSNILKNRRGQKPALPAHYLIRGGFGIWFVKAFLFS
jgi:hypothetical protein